jgi:hypothetical protein
VKNILLSLPLLAPASVYAMAEPQVGLLQVPVFQNNPRTLKCAAFSVGKSRMATASGCFLGAEDCNNATVHFADGRVARCVAVEPHAPELPSWSQKISQVRFFEVDVTFPETAYPLQWLKLTRETADTKVEIALPDSSLSCHSYSQSPVDELSHPRNFDAWQTRCPFPIALQGAPVRFATDKKWVGVVAGHTLQSPETGTWDTLFTPFSTFPSESLSSTEAPKILAVGPFASTTFPNGLPGPLDFVVAKWHVSGPVKVRVHTLSSTEIHIRDGSGKNHTWRGLGSLRAAEAITLEGPLEIRAKTSKSTRALSARIELQ